MYLCTYEYTGLHLKLSACSCPDSVFMSDCLHLCVLMQGCCVNMCTQLSHFFREKVFYSGILKVYQTTVSVDVPVGYAR